MKQYQAGWKAEGTIPGWGLLNLAPESLTYYELLIHTLARYFLVDYGAVISQRDQSQRALIRNWTNQNSKKCRVATATTFPKRGKMYTAFDFSYLLLVKKDVQDSLTNHRAWHAKPELSRSYFQNPVKKPL